jgi:hypothetical protein
MRYLDSDPCLLLIDVVALFGSRKSGACLATSSGKIGVFLVE